MSSYDSTFDARGLRATVSQSGSLTAAGTTTLGHNSRSELTSSGESNGSAKDFTWNCDLIGKRTLATEAGAGTTYNPVGTPSAE